MIDFSVSFEGNFPAFQVKQDVLQWIRHFRLADMFLLSSFHQPESVRRKPLTLITVNCFSLSMTSGAVYKLETNEPEWGYSLSIYSTIALALTLRTHCFWFIQLFVVRSFLHCFSQSDILMAKGWLPDTDGHEAEIVFNSSGTAIPSLILQSLWAALFPFLCFRGRCFFHLTSLPSNAFLLLCEEITKH